ncbi:histidine phosphatase family protein [Alkalihalophilus marmarensis]|uniref:histidine phosphatase family protein n=1 Tax=Alkalihalophilus marmarensis TaxID=521377 RepID=UPI002E20BDAE|nr:phosphoglycerate mutase family protein [Alkalihalophilus marmarensis]
MMEISLIRHGKSQFNEKKRVTCAEFERWVDNYNASGVHRQAIYPPETLLKITSANVLITSDLKRSIDSAAILHPEGITITHSLFRETELPTLHAKHLSIRLKPSTWAVFLRLLWFGGYSNACESVSEAKGRAEKATEQLITYAKESQSVAIVGHGFFNRFISKELQRQGWKGKKKSGTKHWSCTTYTWSD